ISAPTLTGPVDLLNPDPLTITLPAMAHGLGKIDRWAGALEVTFSVAQDSVFVRDIYLRLAVGAAAYWSLYALKHDGHEYVLGDIITPTARLLSAYDEQFMRKLDGIKARIDRAIETRWALPAAPPAILALVAEAD